MTEQLEPTQVVSILNAYFSYMIDIIYHYEGMLDKFLGDGIMCILELRLTSLIMLCGQPGTALAMQRVPQSLTRVKASAAHPALVSVLIAATRWLVM